MIMPKVTFFYDRGYTIKGLIHVGANDGEEVPGYKELGIKNILCFEPMSSVRWPYPDVPLIRKGLHDKDMAATLNIAGGNAKGSSLFGIVAGHPELAKWQEGQDRMVGKEKIQLMRLDSFFESHDYNIDDYDCLVLDTQGNEWEVLHGCGKLLQQFKFLSVELSEVPVYTKEHPGQEVIDWLATKGFKQECPLTSHDDVMFINTELV